MKTQKSRRTRRFKVRVPGGDTRLRYAERKPAKAKCSVCGDVLKGVPRDMPAKVKNMAKTEKRPERPYGGALCSRCTRRVMVHMARSGLK